KNRAIWSAHGPGMAPGTWGSLLSNEHPFSFWPLWAGRSSITLVSKRVMASRHAVAIRHRSQRTPSRVVYANFDAAAGFVHLVCITRLARRSLAGARLRADSLSGLGSSAWR